MKKKLLNFLAVGVFAMCSSKATSGHLQDNLLFSAKLDGAQEVPAVTTNALGVASFMLNNTRDELCISVAVNGLSGAITGAHIHEGLPGTNGGVLLDLTPGIVGNQITLTISGASLTSDLISHLILGETYLNIHTAANVGGEIRGQITLESDWSFVADADGAQEVPAVITSAYGLGVFTLSRDNGNITYKFITQGLSGAITGAHLHVGAMGVNGGVEQDLSGNVMGNVIMGSFTPSASLLTNLLNGDIYLNIHTAANAGGEIRGQLILNNSIAFDSSLDGSQEVPAVSTSAQGVATFSLNSMLNTITYDIVAEGLSGAITGAHLHEGAVGVNGGVLVDFSSNINGNRITGTISGGSVTNDLINALLRGETYINLHTSANAGGEIRGQVYRLAREGYTAILNGDQEEPSVTTNAYGAGVVSINRDQNNLHYMFVIGGLAHEANGVHFHNAAAGANGGVIYDLTPFFSKTSTDDAAFGYWTSADATPFTATESVMFRNNEVYINVHNVDFAAGEIRGQINRGQVCYSVALSIIENGHASQVAVYPNPFNDELTISGNNLPSTFTLEVVDITGKVVLSRLVKNTNNSTLNTQGLNQGIYFLVGKDGNNVLFNSKITKLF